MSKSVKGLISASLLFVTALLLVLVLYTSPSYSDAPQFSPKELTPWAYLPFVRKDPPPAVIRITYIYAPSVIREREYVEIENQGGSPQDMTGWTLTDQARTDTFTFPDEFTLQPGASVQVWSRTGNNTPDRLYWDTPELPIWDVGGDTAYLYNRNGELVDTYSY